MDPDFYVGILHKWVCAPKGCAFMYARPDVQSMIESLVVSWGWEPKNPGPSKYVEFHEWQGSRDISAFLGVPSAIAFQEEHDWNSVRKRCIALASDAQQEIASLTRQPG
jgi:isopenicillin-N epimerase